MEKIKKIFRLQKLYKKRMAELKKRAFSVGTAVNFRRKTARPTSAQPRTNPPTFHRRDFIAPAECLRRIFEYSAEYSKISLFLTVECTNDQYKKPYSLILSAKIWLYLAF